jgi:hypothetical protein
VKLDQAWLIFEKGTKKERKSKIKNQKLSKNEKNKLIESCQKKWLKVAKNFSKNCQKFVKKNTKKDGEKKEVERNMTAFQKGYAEEQRRKLQELSSTRCRLRRTW